MPKMKYYDQPSGQWIPLDANNADKLGGQLPAYYATADHSHGSATASANGFMSKEDKAKLDSIDTSIFPTLGANNQSVNKVKAFELDIDTRKTKVLWTGNQITGVQSLDGATVVGGTTLSYTGASLTGIATVAGGSTVTRTLAYVSGKLDEITKVVS